MASLMLSAMVLGLREPSSTCIARQLTPDLESIKDRIAESRNTLPLSSHFRAVTVADDHIAAQADPVSDGVDSQVIMQMAQELQIYIRKPLIKRSLGESISTYLLCLLADERGLNLGNKISHGIAPHRTFSQSNSNQIFHALLASALVRPQSDGEAAQAAIRSRH